MEVADYGRADPGRVVFSLGGDYRGSFYRGGPIKSALSSGIDQALDFKGKIYGVPVYSFGHSPATGSSGLRMWSARPPV
jgi:hypothetical protein